jgi:hypothetical protein
MTFEPWLINAGIFFSFQHGHEVLRIFEDVFG